VSDDTTPDLALIGAMLRQVIAEQATVRDDMRVLTSIALRQDNTLAALLTEVRTMHAQYSRMDNRVRTLEARS
jgi:hypothetical protein